MFEVLRAWLCGGLGVAWVLAVESVRRTSCFLFTFTSPHLPFLFPSVLSFIPILISPHLSLPSLPSFSLSLSLYSYSHFSPSLLTLPPCPTYHPCLTYHLLRSSFIISFPFLSFPAFPFLHSYLPCFHFFHPSLCPPLSSSHRCTTDVTGEANAAAKTDLITSAWQPIFGTSLEQMRTEVIFTISFFLLSVSLFTTQISTRKKFVREYK